VPVLVLRQGLSAPQLLVRMCRPAGWAQEVRRLAGLPPHRPCARKLSTPRCPASGQAPVAVQVQQPTVLCRPAFARFPLRPWAQLVRVRRVEGQIFWRQALPALSMLQPVGFQRLLL
jgi:hypothetical protein